MFRPIGNSYGHGTGSGWGNSKDYGNIYGHGSGWGNGYGCGEGSGWGNGWGNDYGHGTGSGYDTCSPNRSRRLGNA